MIGATTGSQISCSNICTSESGIGAPSPSPAFSCPNGTSEQPLMGRCQDFHNARFHNVRLRGFYVASDGPVGPRSELHIVCDGIVEIFSVSQGQGCDYAKPVGFDTCIARIFLRPFPDSLCRTLQINPRYGLQCRATLCLVEATPPPPPPINDPLLLYIGASVEGGGEGGGSRSCRP